MLPWLLLCFTFFVVVLASTIIAILGLDRLHNWQLEKEIEDYNSKFLCRVCDTPWMLCTCMSNAAVRIVNREQEEEEEEAARSD